MMRGVLHHRPKKRKQKQQTYTGIKKRIPLDESSLLLRDLDMYPSHQM